MTDSQVMVEGDPVKVAVNPGICGFTCIVKAWKMKNRQVHISITCSECKQVQTLSEILNNLEMSDLFKPVSRTPVFLAAERAACHTSCAIPLVVVKAAEAAMELALPRDVLIRFQPEELENQ